MNMNNKTERMEEKIKELVEYLFESHSKLYKIVDEMLGIIRDANNENKETKTYVLTDGMLKWNDANNLICNCS